MYKVELMRYTEKGEKNMKHKHHHECHEDESCCGHSHEHSHGHHDGCCSHDHCHDQTCCHDHENHNEDFSHFLIQLADEAWMEVLKEKIKENIRAGKNGPIDELAKTVAEANGERWRHKLSLQKNQRDFKNKINTLFS